MRLYFLHASLVVLFFFSQTLPHLTAALPLSTSNRWIVDESGARVKLACVNWPSHLEPMLAEGLSKRPLDGISKSIASMGFNCVRLTWPLYLVTNGSLATVTVRQSFQRLGLNAAIAGIQQNNPWILDLTLILAYKAVVTNLGVNRIMVILDNHITKPGWCCNNNDGNGFFWDQYFDPGEWLTGLTRMATLFNGVPSVVGMSLRNELRGPRANVPDWYRYMQMGAEAVHRANPSVLVILSGLNFDTDLSFLSDHKAALTFSGKLVHELHWYSFSDGRTWAGNANDACGSVTSGVMSRAGFLLGQGVPLFMSEWGVDQRGSNSNDNHYLGCMLAAAAELDLDWSLWALQGSYYLREGAVDTDEVYGALSFDWRSPRNPGFLQRIASLQSPFQGPGLNAPAHVVLYHPATGLCVVQDGRQASPLHLGPCNRAKGWTYSAQQTIQLVGTALFLKGSGAGERVTLARYGDDPSFKWDPISDSKLHISTQGGGNLCLDVSAGDSTLLTNACRCLTKDDRSCDAEVQWFKMLKNAWRCLTKDRSCDPEGQWLEMLTNAERCLTKDMSCDPEGQWFKMVPSTRPLGPPILP